MCSVGSNLNLSIGAVARAMSQTAGPALQNALLKKTNTLSPGEVVHTISTGNLHCCYVVFCVCCPWDKGQGDAKKVTALVDVIFDSNSSSGICKVAVHCSVGMIWG